MPETGESILAVIRVVFTVINAILRTIATTLVAGGSILVGVVGVVVVAGAVAALSGIGALDLLRRKREK